MKSKTRVASTSTESCCVTYSPVTFSVILVDESVPELGIEWWSFCGYIPPNRVISDWIGHFYAWRLSLDGEKPNRKAVVQCYCESWWNVLKLWMWLNVWEGGGEKVTMDEKQTKITLKTNANGSQNRRKTFGIMCALMWFYVRQYVGKRLKKFVRQPKNLSIDSHVGPSCDCTGATSIRIHQPQRLVPIYHWAYNLTLETP